eukprot:1194571-Prorocentrum_minimum.AAC.1
MRKRRRGAGHGRRASRKVCNDGRSVLLLEQVAQGDGGDGDDMKLHINLQVVWGAFHTYSQICEWCCYYHAVSPLCNTAVADSSYAALPRDLQYLYYVRNTIYYYI